MRRILGLSVLSDAGLGWKVGAVIAVAVLAIGVLAWIEFGSHRTATGKHRRPDDVPVHDDDDTGDGDGDDDDWAYELETMNQERAFAEADARHARGEYLTTTPGTRVEFVNDGTVVFTDPDGTRRADTWYERMSAADDADTFLTSVHRRDTIIDPYADDWFDQSMNELLAWADRQDSERFADLMEAAKVARDWEEAIAA